MIDLIGVQGRVTVRIPGGGAPGEISIRRQGMTHLLIAYSDAPVDVGTEAWIIAERGGNAVDVRPTT